MLNPDHEPSLRYGLDAVSLAPALETFCSGESHSPGPNCCRLMAKAQDFPRSTVERDVGDFAFAVTD